MSFYRIYRPQVIDELDNASVKEQLLSLLSKDKKALPHAFLFSGPRGAGKTTAARLVAKLFNCTKPTKSGEPCGACEQCTSIASGSNIDVLEIDAASNTGVDNIRDLRDKIILAPSIATWKVYIIDEVHMLSTGAFNALLKTLEEPPPHAVFVLATTDVHKVPATIISRCVHIVFGRASTQDLVHALSRIVTAEKIYIEPAALEVVAAAADGSFRDGVKLLEQVSFHKGKITADVVHKLLALSSQEAVNRFLQALSERDGKKAFAVVNEVSKSGADLKGFLVAALAQLETLLIAHVRGESTSPWQPESLQRAIRKLSQAYTELRTAAIPELPLELAVVEYCQQAEHIPAPAPAAAAPRKAPEVPVVEPVPDRPSVTGLLTFEKLVEHWKDFIEEIKPYNHSISGVLRSSRPKAVAGGIVTIEAFYKFHQEKLSEGKTRDVIADVLKKLFGEKVKVEIVLGKK